MSTVRTSVFISYSHADLQWLRLLNTHLKPLTRDYKVEIWSDQKIRKGARWREQIHKQLAMARVGIFLVSADFLASDFIHAAELPPLLKAAEKEGATLLTIIVRPCAGAFQDSPLSQLQAMNGPHAPLSGLSKTQREQVMASVYDELRQLFRAPAAAPARRPGPKRKPTLPANAPAASTKTRAAAPARTPKQIVPTPAKTTAAGEAAAREIAKRKAIAKNKLTAAAKKRAAEKTAPPARTPAARKPAAKPTTPRTPKK